MEELKPENSNEQVTYSSQNILSSSAAGQDHTFFTRIKQKKQKPAKAPRKKITLTKKAKIGILIGLGIAIAISVVVLIIIVISSSSTNNSNETNSDDGGAGGLYSGDTENPEELELDLYMMDLNTNKSVEDFNSKINYLLVISDDGSKYGDTIDNLYQSRIAETTDDNIKHLLEIGYASFLVDRGDNGGAISILDEISKNEEGLNPAIKEKLYAAYLYYYNMTDGDQALFDEYTKKLDAVMEKLYPSESVATPNEEPITDEEGTDE